MSTQSVNDEAWLKNPYTWRNNRGTTKLNGCFVRFGIPEPKGKEKNDDMKGSDRVGFEQVVITPEMVGKTIAVFKGIEIKGYKDRIKEGQLKWHEWLLSMGAKSEIWKERENGSIEIIKEKINNDNSKTAESN